MKTAISLSDETFRRADRAAKMMGISRSEFFARAAKRWLDDLDDEGTTAAIDRAIAGLPTDTTFTDAAAAALAERGAAPVIGRGELWWADLGLPRGSAPALR